MLRYIYSTRSWNKDYRIKMALIRNPKVPSGISLKFMAGLRDSDIKALADDRSVPAAIKAAAKRTVDAKNKPSSAGGNH